MTATSIFQGLAQDTHLTDSSLRGIVGPLVKIPVPAYVSTTNGAATISASTNGAPDNPDGSGGMVNLVVPAAIGNRASITLELFGPIIGVRFLRRSVATIFPFDLVIDGVAYPVERVVPRRDNAALAATEYESLVIVADDLTDRLHTVELHVEPDPALAQSNSLFLYGFLVARGRGYNDVAPTRGMGLVAPVTLTTTATAMTTTAQPFSALSFHNTDVASRTVTVYGSDGTSIYKVLTLAAGTSATVTFQTPKKITTWKWKADAASVVTAWMENA